MALGKVELINTPKFSMISGSRRCHQKCHSIGLCRYVKQLVNMYAPASAASCRDLRDLGFQHAGMDAAVTENTTSLIPYRFVTVWMVWQKHLTQPQSWLNLKIVDSSAKITFQHVFQVTHPPTKKNIQKSSCNLSHDFVFPPVFFLTIRLGMPPDTPEFIACNSFFSASEAWSRAFQPSCHGPRVSLKNGNSTNKKP